MTGMRLKRVNLSPDRERAGAFSFVKLRDHFSQWGAMSFDESFGGRRSTARQGQPAAASRAKSIKVRLRGIWDFTEAFSLRFGRENLSLVAAGIAFYGMFSIFPGLAAIVAVYGLFGDVHVVETQMAEYSGLMPPEAAKLVTDALVALLQKPASGLSTALAVAIGLALWSARAGTSALMTGLNIAYERPEERSFLVQQCVAIGLTAGGIVFAILSLTAIAGVPIAIGLLPLSSGMQALLAYTRWPLLGLCILLALAAVYRFAPSRPDPCWRMFSVGSLTAAFLWIAGSAAFSFYVGRFGSYDATYGSLGAVIVLLLWFWVSALVVLCGATLDALITERIGCRAKGAAGA